MNIRVGEVITRAVNRSSLLFLVLISTCGPAVGSEVTGSAATDDPASAIPSGIGEPNDGKMTQQPSVQELGGEKFRIGAITVDRARRLITVPGRMLPYEEVKPIEFIATMTQGYKSYESVLSLDANAFEFNLACILIGLDADKASEVTYHFDPEPVEGDKVSIRVGWRKNGQWIEKDAVELLNLGRGKPVSPSVWVYTGSRFIEGDRYLAQMDGVLIGLIHDPASIIEHREGIGLGDWGSVTVDSEMAPAGGHEIVLRVQRLD